jgi:hypothetical protein
MHYIQQPVAGFFAGHTMNGTHGGKTATAGSYPQRTKDALLDEGVADRRPPRSVSVLAPDGRRCPTSWRSAG